VEAVKLDVASEDSVKAKVEATTRAFGRRDALVA
jgi:NAD(P)-dependent dehydrogenase (short-subunit alcohol dehydrogenase family)